MASKKKQPRKIAIFEYPEDYWSLSEGVQKKIKEWAVKVLEQVNDPNCKSIEIPPGSSLYNFYVDEE